MTRAYKTVSVADDAAGFAVTLDGRSVRTPARRPLVLPARALAEAVAAEWAGQGESVEPATMPLTRLAATALDRVGPAVAEVREAALAFAETDALCYRAAAPATLVARQEEAWQPLLAWAEARFGAPLVVTTGIVPVAQPAASLAALAAALAAFDPFPLTAVHAIAQACGSLVLALAVAEGRLDAEAAWRASLVDELYQAEHWGEDREAVARRGALSDEIATAARFLGLLSAG